MPKITSESAFEEHIEAVLLTTHGFLPAQQADYDKARCLRPETVISAAVTGQIDVRDAEAAP